VSSDQSLWFSVIIPVYNRETTVLRALRSCLSQAQTSLEVIVIDDGSTDGTAQTLASIEDPRVRVVTHPENRGVGAARNSGIAVAEGRWLIMLDSDNELAPGALDVLAGYSTGAAGDVGNIATQCLWDDGRVTPGISLVQAVPMDYRQFLAWSDGLAQDGVEWFNCVRREVFEGTSFPDGRAHEGGLHLDLASRWRFEIRPDVCLLYHQDVPGITRATGSGAVVTLLRDAPDQRKEMDRILERHGDALRAWAPRRYASFLRSASLYCYLMGARRDGFSRAKEALRREPLDVRTVAITGLGLTNRQLLARVKVAWQRPSAWRSRSGRSY
jgi:glycosyltransferase involved in cell wall biosynthesis